MGAELGRSRTSVVGAGPLGLPRLSTFIVGTPEKESLRFEASVVCYGIAPQNFSRFFEKYRWQGSKRRVAARRREGVMG
jgi:hypothetical protein